LEKDGEVQPDTLEAFISAWLGDHERRQLALLGEYGQGKSTASLLLSYHLMQRAASDATTRIPILNRTARQDLAHPDPGRNSAKWWRGLRCCTSLRCCGNANTSRNASISIPPW